ncbi:MAG: TolC family protein [Bacteroidales bacterium]|jgi:outer membrane protein|nr:TolC family protein [Bacteroidales bacterium]
MIQKTLYIILCFFYSISTFSQDSLSLERAIELALENNFSILISKNSETIASINNSWGNTGGIPMLTFTSSASHVKYDALDETPNNSDNTQNRFSNEIALQWTLFDGFSAVIEKEKLEYLEKISEGNVRALIEGTIFSTIQAYHSVLVQKHAMISVGEIQTVSKERYDYQKKLQNLGVATTFEVLQTQNAWLEDTAQYVMYQAQYNTAIRNLKFIIADSSNISYLFADTFEPQHITFDRKELKRKIPTQNTQVQNKYMQLEVKKQEVKLAQSNLYPTIQAQAGGTYNMNNAEYSNNTIESDNQQLFANISLNYNIYAAGTRRRAIQIRAIEKHITQLELQEMIFELQNQIEQEYELYESRKIVYNLAQKNLETAKLQFELAEKRFEAGSISSFDFRTIQNQYLRASIQLLEAKYNCIMSETAIFRLTGEIIN